MEYPDPVTLLPEDTGELNRRTRIHAERGIMTFLLIKLYGVYS
jgi:hypothetical protein